MKLIKKMIKHTKKAEHKEKKFKIKKIGTYSKYNK